MRVKPAKTQNRDSKFMIENERVLWHDGQNSKVVDANILFVAAGHALLFKKEIKYELRKTSKNFFRRFKKSEEALDMLLKHIKQEQAEDKTIQPYG